MYLIIRSSALVTGNMSKPWKATSTTPSSWGARFPDVFVRWGGRRGSRDASGETDWLYLEAGGLLPREVVPVPANADPPERRDAFYDFADGRLPMDFQWLRTPHSDRLFRTEPGRLVLIGRESPGSWFEQSLVARRQEDHSYAAETRLEFRPTSYQQGAGLTTYYNRYKFYALMVTHDAKIGRCLSLLSSLGDYPGGSIEQSVALEGIEDGHVDLKVEILRGSQQFFYRQGGTWSAIGPKLDARKISDEGQPGEHQSFTGTFVGMMAYDMTGRCAEATFSSFLYRPLNEVQPQS